MTAIWIIVSLGVIFGTGYYAFALYAAWVFFRARRGGAESDATPPVTLLKPVRGLAQGLEANLESFFVLDYPDYQILFGVSDDRDPAIEVIERLRRRYPHRDTDLVVNSRMLGTNRKVANLFHMMPRAKHEILVISDSDIRVPRDYLRQIVRPLGDPAVGLATCLYRAVGSQHAPARFEALYVNTDFMPMVLVAHRVDQFRYAFGATIAIRRAALDAIGGFRAIADYLADDYQLGYRVTGKGYRLALSPLVVETHLDAQPWGALARHQLRWARTNRVCRPRGYFFSVLTHGTSWAAVFLLLSGFSFTGWYVFLATTAVRLIQAAVIGRGYIGGPLTLGDAWLVLIKDWLVTAVWLTSFLGRTVEWGEEQLVLRPDGRMAPAVLGPVEAPAALVLDGRATPSNIDAGRSTDARWSEPTGDGSAYRGARPEDRTI